MVQKIAITGGRGRLAGVAAAYFRQQGYLVTLFSRQEEEGMQLLSDLFDPNVMRSFNALIHTAWSTVPFTSEEDPGREEREDFPFLKNILENLHQIEDAASMPKVIFISSAAVYGNQKSEPATELTLCKPLGGYARAKLFAERLILEARIDDPRLKAVILRVTNLAGIPSRDGVPQGVLSKIVEAVNRHHSLELWGDGKGSKDYLWIDDFLEALKIVIENPVEGIFNIGSGQNFSLLELVKIAEEVVQRPIQLEYHSRYPWDVNSAKISSALFSQITGWEPKSDVAKKMRELLS